MTQCAETTVRDYYDALRNGESLAPYFRSSDSTVKFGISEGLFGYDEVADALQEQTETTADWTIESSQLVVTEHDDGAFATFADEVTMAWTDTKSAEERRFETRWSGTLAPASVERREEESAADTERETAEDDWVFVSMHVSTDDEV